MHGRVPSLFRMRGFSDVPALYQELVMRRESQGYDSRTAKDVLPGGSLGSLVLCVNY